MKLFELNQPLKLVYCGFKDLFHFDINGKYFQ